MSLDLSHVAVHQLFCGMSGKGKSTLVRRLAAKHRGPWKFGFETFKREFSSAPPHGLAWARCIDEQQLRAAVLAGRPTAFYSAPLFPGDRIAGFNFWISWVAKVGKELNGGKLVVIEEIEKTTPHENCPLNPAFSEVIDELRGHKFDVMMVAQRVSTTSRIVRAQSTDLVTFQHVEPCELDTLERQGFHRETMMSLQRGEYIWRQRETGKMWTNRTGRNVSRPPAAIAVATVRRNQNYQRRADGTFAPREP